MEAGAGVPCSDKDTRDIDGLETTAAHRSGQVGLRSSAEKVTGSTAHLKHVYTNARCRGGKREELEATAQQENGNIVAAMEV